MREAGKCAALVIRQTGRTSYEWDRVPCRRPAKFLHDGKEWCWQHKPSGAEEIILRREVVTPSRLVFLNSKQVAARYGHTGSWPRHCKDLRKIARKVGKFLMWRVDELEALETAQLEDERKRMEVKRQKELEDKLKFDLIKRQEEVLRDVNRGEAETDPNKTNRIN